MNDGIVLLAMGTTLERLATSSNPQAPSRQTASADVLDQLIASYHPFMADDGEVLQDAETLSADTSATPAATSNGASRAALAEFEAAFRQQHQQWMAVLARNTERVVRGQYSLHWLNTDQAAWGRRAKPSPRGLTYTDINNVEPYGDVPERATWRNFSARGSVRDPYAGEMPTIDDYTVLERSEVWAANVLPLYEEAKARQWNATRDIPWSELSPLPEDLEKATCQLCTVLTEVEFIAGACRQGDLPPLPAG